MTGSSRGIGAATARSLATSGFQVVINYRDKARRANAVVEEIESQGGQASAARADLTDPTAVAAMLDQIRRRYGRLDLLVLNASGGMERDAGPSYAMRLNRDAQLALLEAAVPLMPTGSRVVFVTSHQAHFYPQRPVPQAYEPVATSKRAGENALRDRIPELSRAGITLVVVSGDMIDGTITVTLLERSQPGTVAARLADVGEIPTIDQFASQIVAAAQTPHPTGHTIYVGGADYVAARPLDGASTAPEVPPAIAAECGGLCAASAAP